MKITPEMIQILIDATAWEHDTRPLHCRAGNNSLMTDGDRQICEQLTKAGFMQFRAIKSNSVYIVTDDGIAYLLKRERKLRGAATKKAGAK